MTANPITFSIDLTTIDRVLAKVQFGPLTDAPLRRMLQRCVLAAQRQAQKRTPVRTGTLRRSETTSLSPGPVPLWAKLGTNIVYAPFIEFGERHDPRAKGTVQRRAGAARMFQDGLIAAMPEIEAAVSIAVKEIETAWRA